MNRQAVAAVGLGLLLTFPWAAAGQTVRPNVLCLIADDLGWGDVSWHDSEIDTPHLHQLARTGIILEQHYVTPMCSSTRAALLSGRYSTRFGLDSATNAQVFPFGMTTLATALAAQGYETGLTGKWHLGSKPAWGPQHFGFLHSYGALAGGVDQLLHLYKRGDYQQTWHRDHEYVDEEGHATDLIAREAIRWIESAGQNERPWFIQVAFTAVHVPIQESDRWIAPYQQRIQNDSRRRFAACATHMDHAIGEILAALDRTAQRQDTLVIFTSDNGASGPWKPSGLYPGDYLASPVLGSNAPLRGGKGTVYEGGIRVPACVNWAGRLPGGVTLHAPVHIVDWMPTLLALTAYPHATERFKFDGRNIWPLLSGAETSPPPRTLYFRRGDTAALRHADWKLIAGNGTEQLFDLLTDPGEARNVSNEQPQVVARLAQLLEQEQSREAGAKLTAPKP